MNLKKSSAEKWNIQIKIRRKKSNVFGLQAENLAVVIFNCGSVIKDNVALAEQDPQAMSSCAIVSFVWKAHLI